MVLKLISRLSTESSLTEELELKPLYTPQAQVRTKAPANPHPRNLSLSSSLLFTTQLAINPSSNCSLRPSDHHQPFPILFTITMTQTDRRQEQRPTNAKSKSDVFAPYNHNLLYMPVAINQER